MPLQILGARVVLVGVGRAGAAFARSWIAAGGTMARVLVRDPARRLPDGLSGLERSTVEDPGPACDVLILAVPDDAIGGVASALSETLSCDFAFHLSGALSGRVLEPLSKQGAAIGSIHPVRPFTGAAGEDWSGAFVAVEGEQGAAEVGARIVQAAGARPYSLSPEAKPLYHASASLAAGGTAAVVSVAVRGWVDCGIPEDVAREALAALASRAVEATGQRPFADAFTGAVARRDVGTVRAHAAALAGRDDALALYRLLAEEILARTPGRGRESEIRQILGAAAGAHP